MNLKSDVEFKLCDGNDIYNEKPLAGSMDLEKLKEYVSKMGENGVMFLKLYRQVFIMNDDMVLYPMKDGLDGGSFTFFVQDKLIYPSSINSILLEKHKTGSFDLRFENFDKINNETPLVLFEKKYKNQDYGGHKKYNMCRPLNADDIVVDRKLNQIWPKKTNNPPVALLELLKRKQEIVRCK